MITISNLPTWEPNEIWNILQLQYMSIGNNEPEKGDYIVTFFDSEDSNDIHDVNVDQSILKEFVQKIQRVNINLTPQSESGGPDCGLLRLEVFSGLTNIRLEWFGGLADDWLEVKSLVFEMLSKLRECEKIKR